MTPWICDVCHTRNPGKIRECEMCGKEAPAATASGEPSGLPLCAACQAPTRAIGLTPGEDGVSRCTACHIAFLKRRAELDPVSPEDLARCKAKLAEAFTRADAKWRSHRPDTAPPLERLVLPEPAKEAS